MPRDIPAAGSVLKTMGIKLRVDMPAAILLKNKHVATILSVFAISPINCYITESSLKRIPKVQLVPASAAWLAARVDQREHEMSELMKLQQLPFPKKIQEDDFGPPSLAGPCTQPCSG